MNALKNADLLVTNRRTWFNASLTSPKTIHKRKLLFSEVRKYELPRTKMNLIKQIVSLFLWVTKYQLLVILDYI